MNWICPVCNEELGELNAYCLYCKYSSNIIIFNPDRYFVRDIRINHLINGDKPVTPAEELFAEFFNKHINIIHPWVKDMNLLEIRAYRDRMSLIAKEANAAVHACQAGEEEIKRSKKADGKPTGFERSINEDETSTQAINAIKDRQKRMSKQEKIIANMVKNGIDEKVAIELMSAGSILAKVKIAAKESAEKVEESKPIFNPFAKKESQ